MERFTVHISEYAARLRERTAIERREAEAGTCPTCDGSGVYRNERGAVYACPCRRTGPIAVTADGVPHEFREATIENCQARDGQQTAIHAATAIASDLYLFGGVGAGKTMIAAAIANTWAAQRRTAYFARVPMLLYRLQPGREAEECAALERRILTTSLLVLDDLGAERDAATDYTRRTLLMLYEDRCDAGLRTVFTSNKSLAELSEQQDDDRLSSRIAGRCVVVQVRTPDQRPRLIKGSR